MYEDMHDPNAPTVVYDIRNDSEALSDIASASLSKGRLGLVMTHGIVGSTHWWDEVKNGRVEILAFVGVILRVDGGPMGDSAIVRIEGSSGEMMSWVAWNGFDADLIGRTVKAVYTPVAPKFPPRPGFVVEVLLQVQIVDKPDFAPA